ncbi:hypothetical protein [Aeromicrobium sp. CTD01-1L150]|uniref:hypothetical protein n=1 Tax=Aeromicrobium sp. CTD01-1L150 TaxID=3341830 RepID=UPI0035C140AF
MQREQDEQLGEQGLTLGLDLTGGTHLHRAENAHLRHRARGRLTDLRLVLQGIDQLVERGTPPTRGGLEQLGKSPCGIDVKDLCLHVDPQVRCADATVAAHVQAERGLTVASEDHDTHGDQRVSRQRTQLSEVAG